LLIVNRTAAVAKAALEVLRTAPPTSWAYAPPVYVIEAIPELQALVQDAGDAELGENDARLAEALLGLPAFVQAWRAEKRALLASLLPKADPEPESVMGACSSATTSASDLKVDVVERVDRATSVYTCLGSWVGGMSVTSGRALIGWADAGAHLRCRSLKSFWDRRPHYAPEGAAAAEALVRLVGLDPERVSAAEMDAVCGGEVPGWGGGGRAGGAGKGKGKADPDKRFLCLLCPVEVYRRVHGRRAMRWRECVSCFASSFEKQMMLTHAPTTTGPAHDRAHAHERRGRRTPWRSARVGATDGRGGGGPAPAGGAGPGLRGRGVGVHPVHRALRWAQDARGGGGACAGPVRVYFFSSSPSLSSPTSHPCYADPAAL
jgi:hypothetical protein